MVDGKHEMTDVMSQQFLDEKARELMEEDIGLSRVQRRLWRVFLGSILLSIAMIALMIEASIGGGFILGSLRVHVGALMAWSLIVAIYSFYSLHVFAQKIKTRLARRVFLDDLTDVFNFRYLESRLEQEEARVDRYGGSTSVVYLDLDRFKDVNDRFGHQAGNLVLQGIRDELVGQLRAADVLGRWGGDEFLAILPHTDIEGAMVAGERMRKVVEAHEIELDGGDVVDFVTISTGIAEYPADGDTMADVVKFADKGVYRGKDVGGNAVHHGKESPVNEPAQAGA